MNLLYYLIEANAYILVFYAFYRIVLKNETFYTYNRFYLLFTGLVSFILPGIELSGLYTENSQIIYASGGILQPESSWSPFNTILIIYLIIVAILLLKLGMRLYRICNLVNMGRIKKENGYTLVEVEGSDFSFSFMNYLFINPRLPKADTIIRHEEVHIRQNHSLDVLFFEILKIINWFNPIIRLIQSDVKALHEFIADEETAHAEASVSDYAMFLIHNSCGSSNYILSSQIFSKTLLKKRILMLNQERSTNWARGKYGLLLFLVPLMLCCSALAFTKEYGFIDLMPLTVGVQQDTTEKIAPPPPPAPPKAKSIVKFPPPVVIPQNKTKNNTSGNAIAPPPPPAPPKARSIVKFPSPVVIPQNKTKNNTSGNVIAPPPPPVPPKVKSIVKFPPPVVIPQKETRSNTSGKAIAPPPPPEPPKPQEIRIDEPVIRKSE